jgi:DNA-binding PadR family transcriptional regulator
MYDTDDVNESHQHHNHPFGEGRSFGRRRAEKFAEALGEGGPERVRRNRDGRGHGRGHRHGGPGGPGFGPGGPGFGPGGPGGQGVPPWMEFFGGPGGRRRGRGPRVRRGDVRGAILDVLAGTEDELNGYQVIQEIADKSEGAWRPSPGSVYPTIAQLEDEGLVDTDREGGRKVVFLTDAGREYVAAHTEELAAIWATFSEAEADGSQDLRSVAGQTMAAVWQVAMSGSHDQHQQAAAILADTRRKLYGVLAEGPGENPGDSSTNNPEGN